MQVLGYKKFIAMVNTISLASYVTYLDRKLVAQRKQEHRKVSFGSKMHRS